MTAHFALLKGKSLLQAEHGGDGDVTSQPGFKDIVDLVRAGHLWIKISAPYRVSDLAPRYEDLREIVRAFVDTNQR